MNGQAIGKVESRFLSEGLDLSLMGRRGLRLDKASWLSSRFQLKDRESDDVLVEAQPTGLFSSTWSLTLSCGSAEMKRTGFFSSSYDVKQGSRLLGRVDRLGVCERGWRVDQLDEELGAPDLILVGLIYHVIQKRQQQSAAAAGS